MRIRAGPLATDRWDCLEAIGLCVTAARAKAHLLGRVDELRWAAGDRLEPGVARLVDARIVRSNASV